MRSFLVFCYLLAALPLYAELDLDALPKVVPGFEVNFFAQEPDLINPASLVFDRKGRLFVGAGPQYRNPKPDSPTDYIKIFIDSDDDGVADEVKTFAEGFNCIEAMAWKGDELWVANSPELTVLRDTDGDDVADEYQVIYTGLNNLRHGLHGLNWGPDGWLYMSIGNTWVEKNAPLPFRELQGIESDDTTEYPLSKVYTRDSYPKTYHALNKREMEGGILRCRSGGHDLEIWARGMRNPYDICMDTGFNWIGTDNDPGPPADRIFMPVQYGHYTFRHPWIFDWIGKHGAVAPSSDLFLGKSGSGTGVAYYTSAHFPGEYRGHYLIADWTNNCVFLYKPKWDGALQVPEVDKIKLLDAGVTQAGDLGYKGADGKSLFRPTDIAIGPSGALFIGGWGSVYGTEYVPKDKWTAVENAKYQGRVFRLRHEFPLIPRKTWYPAKRDKPIASWSFAELLADMGHQLPVWRVNAQDEIVRRGQAVRGALLAAINGGRLNEGQLTWSIWALGRIDAQSDQSAMLRYASGEFDGGSLNLRVQALRILGENNVRAAVPTLIGALGDAQPRIRHAAITALGATGFGEQAVAVLDAVADETDRLTRYTAWQVLRRHLSADARRELLQDHRSGVRYMALLSLAEEDAAAPADVLALQEDPDQEVREMAKQWLEKTGVLKVSLRIDVSEPNFRESTEVKMQISGKGAFDIRYTLDGSVPTADSARYDKPLRIESDATVTAAIFAGTRAIGERVQAVLHRINDAEWADRLFVQDLKAKSKISSRAIADGLQRGVQAYSQGSSTIVALPEGLAGATLLQTHSGDSATRDPEFIRFATNLAATLYIAYDARHDPPEWIRNGFTKTPGTLTLSKDDAEFAIYER
ncbi:MAG: putative membrane-bound dehydrogenase-like protein, partial [Rhodothermales bacterium]